MENCSATTIFKADKLARTHLFVVVKCSDKIYNKVKCSWLFGRILKLKMEFSFNKWVYNPPFPSLLEKKRSALCFLKPPFLYNPPFDFSFLFPFCLGHFLWKWRGLETPTLTLTHLCKPVLVWKFILLTEIIDKHSDWS
jgi:hypothetical protein